MPRTALDDWKHLLGTTDELESPLEGSGIAAAPEEDDGPDIDLDVPPSPMGRAAVPAQGGAAPPLARPVSMPLPRARRMAGGRAELEAAQAQDKEEKRKAAFETGLDIAAFRKPFQPRDVGTPNADALTKRMGLERQDRQDARQERVDSQTEALNAARIAKLGQGRAPLSVGDRTILEKALELEPGSLANASDKTIERITGVKIATGRAGSSAAAAEAERKWREVENEKDRRSRERAASLGAGAKVEDKLNEDVKDYAKAIPDGAASFFEQERVIDDLLKKYAGKDIPGVGAWDSRKPNFLQSEDGLTMQKNAQQMMLAYQKAVTGAGGSAEELAKIAKAGADMEHEASFAQGFKSLGQNYRAFMRKIQGGFRPEVVQKFEERVPEMRVPRSSRDGSPVSRGAPDANLAGPPDDKVTISKPGEAPLRIPRSRLKEAQADGWAEGGP